MDEPVGQTEPSSSRARLGVLLAFLGAACWGFSATCVSWLTTRANVDVMWLANMRVIIAGTLFMAIALIRDRRSVARLFTDRVLRRHLLAYTAIGVILVQASYMAAIKYTNPGTALLLQETGVPLIVAIECIRLRRRPSAREIAGLALACVGVVLIATQGDPTTLAINPLGLFWGLVAGASIAGYNLISVRMIRECGAFATNGAAMVIAAVILTPIMRPWEGAASLDGAGWLVLLGVTIVGTFIAYAAYLRGVADAGPVKASLIGVFEPISGAFFSAVWLGTVFSTWDFLGGIAIIVMMVIVARQ